MASIQTRIGKRYDLTKSLNRMCTVLLSQGIDAGVPAERETGVETWAQMLWQIAEEYEAQAYPAPGTDLLITALRAWAHAARRSLESDAIGQAGFDAHMLDFVNALGEWEVRRIDAQVADAKAAALDVSATR